MILLRFSVKFVMRWCVLMILSIGRLVIGVSVCGVSFSDVGFVYVFFILMFCM